MLANALLKENSRERQPKGSAGRRKGRGVTEVERAAADAQDQDDGVSGKKGSGNHGAADNGWNVFSQSSRRYRLRVLTWAYKTELRRARMYPEGLAVDTTWKTFNQSWPLLDGVVKDSENRMIPAWYSWLFTEDKIHQDFVLCRAVPKIFGKDWCSRVCLLAVDGDEKLWDVLSSEIGKQVYTSAMLRLCLFHLLTQETQDMLATLKESTSVHIIEKFFDYLWRLSETETRDEAERLWLDVEHYVRKQNGRLFADFKFHAEKLIHTLQLKQHKWVGFYFHDVFTLGIRTQGGSESNHGRIKSKNGIGISGRNAATTSVQTLEIMANTREKKLASEDQDIASRAIRPTDRGPALAEAARHLGRHAYQLFFEQFELANNYVLHWVELDNSEVAVYVRLHEDAAQLPPGARTTTQARMEYIDSLRVRIIRWNKQTKCLVCTCAYLERLGIPCRHLICFLLSLHQGGEIFVRDHFAERYLRKNNENADGSLGQVSFSSEDWLAIQPFEKVALWSIAPTEQAGKEDSTEEIGDDVSSPPRVRRKGGVQTKRGRERLETHANYQPVMAKCHQIWDLAARIGETDRALEELQELADKWSKRANHYDQPEAANAHEESRPKPFGEIVSGKT